MKADELLPAPLKGNPYCLPADKPQFGKVDKPAQLPRSCIYTATTATLSNGLVYAPPDSVHFSNILASLAGNSGTYVDLNGNLAIGGNPLQCGDVIVLAAGTVYDGLFTLPAKQCDPAHWITIRTSAIADASFPSEGIRATPCEIGLTNDDAHNGGQRQVPGYPDYVCLNPAVRMPTLNSGHSQYAGALAFANGANYYRLIGLNIQKLPGSPPVGKLVALGGNNPTRGADHIILDRVLIHGEPWIDQINNQTQAAIEAVNSTNVAVIDSWVYDTYCIASCIDSQGFHAGTGPIQDGPFKIANNLIASSGEAFMFGGGGQGPGTPNTRDVEIWGNHLFKPLTWMIPIGTGQVAPFENAPIIKNNGEIKNGIRMLIEYNVCENVWQGQSDQNGFCLLLAPKSQNAKVPASVNFDGTALVTAAKGKSFVPAMADPARCPLGGCVMEINDVTRGEDDNNQYRICNVATCGQSGYVSPTQVILTTTPPMGSDVHVYACPPGNCPSCRTEDITVRYNEFRNLTNGILMASGRSSHCLDESAGMKRYSIHDNVLHALSNRMNNGFGPATNSVGVSLSNGQLVGVANNVTVFHNTVAVAEAPSNSCSGLGVQADHTDVSYLSNVTYRDNLAPESLHISHTKGSHAPGGLALGLSTQSCLPVIPNEAPDGVRTSFTLPTSLSLYMVTRNGVHQPVTNQSGTGFTLTRAPQVGDVLTARDLNTCTWAFFNNVMGVGLAGSGLSENPYPPGNDTPDANTFTSQFVNWNGGAFGDYRLCRAGLGTCSGNSIYLTSASDAAHRPQKGKGIGANADAVRKKTAGVAQSTHYPALSVGASALPAAAVGEQYNVQLIASGGASPFKEWMLAGGSLPTGLALGRDGRIGSFDILTLQRDKTGLSSVTFRVTLTGGAFVIGQTVTIAGLHNGNGIQAADSTFNGTFKTTALVGSSTVQFSQVGQPAVASHIAVHGGTIGQSPSKAGTHYFTVQVRDGGRQVATKELSITVN